MSDKVELYQLDTPKGGIERKLAEGMSTQIFAGDLSMLSIVTIEPGAMGVMHQHPEEQWGVVLEGSATRYQGDIEFALRGACYHGPCLPGWREGCKPADRVPSRV